MRCFGFAGPARKRHLAISFQSERLNPMGASIVPMGRAASSSFHFAVLFKKRLDDVLDRRLLLVRELVEALSLQGLINSVLKSDDEENKKFALCLLEDSKSKTIIEKCIIGRKPLSESNSYRLERILRYL
jgi:hypothetical protein